MNKKEFITELEKRLQRLPKQDIENALNYYVEYFEDANISDEADVIQLFDNPATIASEILADYAINQPKQARFSFKGIWFILLAILAAPIGLPLALVFILLLLVPVIIILSFIFAFGLSTVILIIAGIGTAILALIVLPQSLPTTVLYLGASSLVIGIGLMFGLFVLLLTRLSITWITKVCRNLLNRTTKRGIKIHEA